MPIRTRIAMLVLLCCSGAAFAQSLPTAKRRADLQIGLGGVIALSDYESNAIKGGAFYFTFDFTNHFGIEGAIHQANSSVGDSVYERTYEIGGRYYREYGKLAPYIKLMYGRGVFNFPYSVANLAYNFFAGGGGVDYRVLPYLNVRADYEYQRWTAFPPQGLTPQLITIGVAYHFPGGLHRGLHY